ncbi:10946_t:CDS:10 [Diversispora eburnea]|uniref:10946_t:CDS:1 n=1 Tax=Diversispora eburnea TaxID=1213867 RepID=A0A9N8ZVQ2_9GLOM|nr:10946_t:CDS:10 [Diversispora eburnea]
MDAPPLSPNNEQGQPHPGNINFSQQRPSVNSHLMSQLHMGPIPYRPLLPSGWTEHRAPNGMFYYYNASTGQSTWERPIMVPPPPPPPLGHPSMNVASHPFQQMPGMIPNLQQQNVTITQQSKEQPKEKKKEKAKEKKPIPNTKWSLVMTTEGNEFYFNSETKKSVWEIPEEISELVKQMKEQMKEQATKDNQKSHDKAGIKRKAEDDDESKDIAYQLQFMEDQDQELLSETGSGDSHDQLIMNEEGFQQQDKGKEVNFSLEERIIMFKSLLRDVDVSPYSIWEKELPRIIHDSRYTLIPTLKQKKEIYDEFCKERAKELRIEKNNKIKNLSAKDEYLKLLEEETTYRSHWDSFKTNSKRDPRFKNFGDDKEKEKLFRKYVRDLKEKEAERKRENQKKADDDFRELLSETRGIKYDSSWRRVKRIIESDPRYAAVQSATQREELFRKYCKKLEAEDEEEMARREQERKQRERKAREEESLRNREAQVRNERRIQNYDRNSTKKRLLREESIREFQTLLVDLVRTHEITWESKKSDLARDHRYNGEGLEDFDRERLFNEYIDNIYIKCVKEYYQLLDKHVKLDTTWLEIYPIVKDDRRAVKLSKSEDKLEKLFDDYMKMRIEKAKEEFLQLLKENQFLEYRARMVRLSENGAKDETGAEKEKARELKLEEIHDVLKDDTRFLALNHMPEERDEFINEYLKNTEAPKLTVHQGRE